MNFAYFSSRLLWGFEIVGKENIPQNEPLIISPNHQSLLDSPLLIYALPKIVRKKTYALAKIELTKMPFISYLIRHANVIPFERSGDIVTPLKASFEILKSKKNLIIFPEGTRSFTEKVGPFKSGVGLLLKETDCSLLPIRIINANTKWRKGKLPSIFSGWRDRPKLIIGKPVTYKELLNKKLITDNSTDMEITNVIRNLIINLTV